MKHSIFVTVEEFVANGGTLSTESAAYRQLYKQTEYLTYEPLGWYDLSVQTYLPYSVIVSQRNRTFQMDVESVFVEIECQPIYK